ncbi:helix-turn-helix domain-containing protein [Parvibaculum sp.]|uniref:helix-turn-helix domain-containing protein n=1 Tax=Parvibaculum sp. TaxID=2024848 RepID=UPI002725F548|nr:helix-turn-helix domain-containing protein [Parvibaculum sp.]MDO9127761.1 helix-turn-helix domain-containing protein [Parvibaculum sp.]MDP1627468.1 helix-turn-helix domain-containing protein [Parvibaculum sp.]MDP2148647.1 helix-turn-helix domain-containing protein [Parvibaculum sp.]MDP3326673.1 helix-turn-helix domain-containing protein [Parvibaculum sp.]
MDRQDFAETGWVAVQGGQERAAQVALMQETVARAWNVPVDEMRSPTRRRAPVAQARQVAMYLTHVLYGFSLSAVGRYFGRDRTTAAHACRLIEDRRDDENFDMLLDRLEHALRRAGTGQVRQ